MIFLTPSFETASIGLPDYIMLGVILVMFIIGFCVRCDGIIKLLSKSFFCALISAALTFLFGKMILEASWAQVAVEPLNNFLLTYIKVDVLVVVIDYVIIYLIAMILVKLAMLLLAALVNLISVGPLRFIGGLIGGLLFAVLALAIVFAAYWGVGAMGIPSISDPVVKFFAGSYTEVIFSALSGFIPA